MADFSYIAPNIIVGTDPAQSVAQVRASKPEVYKKAVLDCLDEIWDKSWTGTAVIQAIAKISGKKVIITPFNDPFCNAESDPLPSWGKPGEISVRFSPSAWSSNGSCSKGAPGSMPDEVLLHELVHAYRQMKGRVLGIGVSVPGFQYENEHEFYSILLTNIHMSVKNQRVLRRDHRRFSAPNSLMYPELSSSEPFLTNFSDHRRLVKAFVTENSDLCTTICRDQCAFNPISYFMKNSLAMRQMDIHRAQPTKLELIDDANLQKMIDQSEKLLNKK